MAESPDPQKIRKLIENCKKLPTLPGVAIQLLEQCREADVDLQETAEIMSRDPALSAKVLEFVNSPFFGLRREVTTLSHGVALLGFNSIRTLALSFSLVNNLKDDEGEGFDYSYYWKHSIIAAASARAMARRRHVALQEELFLAALLQDIGMLALQAVTPHYGKLFETSANDQDRLLELERRHLGITHAEASVWMAQLWKLPEIYTTLLQAGHDPSVEFPEELEAVVACVALSGPLADLWLAEEAGTGYETLLKKAKSLADMEEEELIQLLDVIRQSVPDMAALFEVQVQDSQAIEGILEEAKEQLVRVSLESMQQTRNFERKVTDLAAENDNLRERSLRDPLTGIYNRAGLERFLKREFTVAQSQGLPLSLVYCDIDRFKQVNDTYGHSAGDQVISHFAETIGRNVREMDIVARYGGDEFVMILPGAEKTVASKVAERIREAIAGNAVEITGGEPIQVTTSLGFATYCAEQTFGDVEELCAAADAALYESKNNGRNQATGWTGSLANLQQSSAEAHVAGHG